MKCYIVDSTERWTTVVKAESEDEAFEVVSDGSENGSKILQRDLNELNHIELTESEYSFNNCPICSGRGHNIDALPMG
tara:strand:+ start:806 stop:1039 length:234 start_codon:yes stop_codon:yes gene_type:complete